jgi:cell division protein ZapA
VSKEKDSIATYLSRVISNERAPQSKNKVEVRIAGDTFTILAAESEDYIRRVASHVDSQISTVTKNNRIPLLDAAILAACNITDEQFKASENAENMRVQLKAYLDDIARLRLQVNELQRELAKYTRDTPSK